MLDVLVVDDDDIVRESVSQALVLAGHRVAQASDGEVAMSLFATRAFDVAVCDVHMPKMDGLTLCRRLRREAPGTALVIMTSYGNVPDAVESLRGGVVDYIAKPFDPDEFATSVVGPIGERHALRKKLEDTRAGFIRREAGTSLVGASLPMRRLAEAITVAARTDASVLVRGERGTGKKLVARLIHAESPRREGPFVVVPCAASVDPWFQSASGGTLVLDGIERLSQDRLDALRRLVDEPILCARRSREWRPLGVRVISIATSDPEDILAPLDLPEALRMRLDGMELHAPPLRDREGDLYVLACHFLRELTPPARSVPGLTARAWKALAGHAFPGNVLELGWVIGHALALSNGDEIDIDHLPDEVTRTTSLGTGTGSCGSSPW
jgi:two-component system, NtrC family, response regulator HydG